MKLLNKLFILSISVFTLFFIACDDKESAGNGTAHIQVTDAAVDAENITGVFLSVSEIQATSESGTKTIATFEEPVIFNVMEYQNGTTFDLGEGEIEVGNYEDLRLILTDGSPSSGTSSSYIQFQNGTTQDLDIPSGTSSGYKVKGDYQISANNETNLIIDIDLRKALVLTGNDDYMLKPTARLVVDESLSVISGSVTNYSYDPDAKWVVYAYNKGEFDESETEEPVEGGSRFENSINSAVVAEDGFYKLSFMEEGEYDLIVSKNEMNETEHTYEFLTVVETEMMVGTNILNLITLSGGSNASVNLVLIN